MMMTAGRTLISPSAKYLPGADSRGFVAMAVDVSACKVFLYGTRAKDGRIHHWLQEVSFDSPIPPWVSADGVRHRNHLAHQAAALMEVLIDNPTVSYTPQQLFYAAFHQDPDAMDIKHTAEALAVFEGLDAITFKLKGLKRYDIMWR